ncbi:MAG: hypothetical protein HYV08_18130 [Deltaproteobacteria bacterium]|nr:hypothetical protein [Deltaproteobacteria bacterium]
MTWQIPRRWRWCLAAIPLLAGCETIPLQRPIETPLLTPITVERGASHPVGFQRVAIRIAPGTPVGAFHEGLLRVPQYPLTWQGQVTAVSEQLNAIATEELKGAGYEVVGGPSGLFEVAEREKVRFLIGGVIANLAFNTYGILAGNKSDASVVVQWEIMDAGPRQVVLTRTSSGAGSTGGQSAAALLVAFRNAFRTFLADRSVAELLTKRVPARPAEPQDPHIY